MKKLRLREVESQLWLSSLAGIRTRQAGTLALAYFKQTHCISVLSSSENSDLTLFPIKFWVFINNLDIYKNFLNGFEGKCLSNRILKCLRSTDELNLPLFLPYVCVENHTTSELFGNLWNWFYSLKPTLLFYRWGNSDPKRG